MECLHSRQSWENQKPPENRPKSGLFRGLAFYNAPSLHTVKMISRRNGKRCRFFGDWIPVAVTSSSRTLDLLPPQEQLTPKLSRATCQPASIPQCPWETTPQIQKHILFKKDVKSGARLRGRTATHRSKKGSKKGSEKVLGKGSQKGSQKGACCGF